MEVERPLRMPYSPRHGVKSSTRSLTWVAATIGVMIAGTPMVLLSRAQESARDLFRGLVLLAVLGAGSATVVTAIKDVFDGLAQDVFVGALKHTPSETAATMTIGPLKTNARMGVGFIVLGLRSF